MDSDTKLKIVAQALSKDSVNYNKEFIYNELIREIQIDPKLMLEVDYIFDMIEKNTNELH